MISNISPFTVILAAFVGFAAGALWYKVFGTAWRVALGRTEPFKAKAGPFIVAIIAQLIMAYVLAAIIGEAGTITMESGIVIGALVWLGFVATSIAVNDSFAGSPVSLTLIDAGHWLIVLVLMGAVIGVFGAA